MVAIREHGTRTPENPVHGSGEPCSDRLHPAPKRAFVVRFDDQVGVIPLERVVDKPEPLPVTRSGERALDLADDANRAKRGNAVAYPEGHMTGKTIDDRPARPVSDTRIRTGLSSGSRPTAAMPQSIEVELFRLSHRSVD